VAIHLFPNGNGRHARLIADIFLKVSGQPQFSWGQKNLLKNSSMRNGYIKALKNADRHNYDDLLAFVRS
jgi:fido (protein-threonine AMPylation protein)